MPNPASRRSRLLTGGVHFACDTRLPESRYAAVSGAAVADADGVGAAVDPAKISPSPDLRQALPEYPGAAPPSHGRCMSQKIVNLLRGVACVVSLSAVMRYDAATTAGRLVSA